MLLPKWHPASRTWLPREMALTIQMPVCWWGQSGTDTEQAVPLGLKGHIVKMEKSNSMGSLLIWQAKQKVRVAFHFSFLPRAMGQLPQNTGTQFLESQGPVPKDEGWTGLPTPSIGSVGVSGRNQVCRIQTLQHMVVIHEAQVQELSKKVANISHSVLSKLTILFRGPFTAILGTQGL